MFASLLSLASFANGDIFLHNPQGSNNRFSSDNRAVNNPMRMFNSMNSWFAKNNQGNIAYDGGYNSPLRDGNMKYFVGSVLPIEFHVNQGCGSGKEEDGAGENSAHCDIVIQYMCSDQLRDGSTENAISSNGLGEDAMMRVMEKTDSGLDYMYGMHENYDYAMACSMRQRNLGLFVADRTINGGTAAFTRANREGRWYGFECAEERDYYPYWAPSPWRDIAILTDDVTKCAYYQTESQNVKEKGYCEGDLTKIKEDDCDTWKEFKPWSKSHSFITAPDCIEAPWVGDSQFGNRLDGYPITYNWTIPDEGFAGCALRVRYNVSMGDFEGWNIEDSNRVSLSAIHNGDNSPIQMDPDAAAMLAQGCCGTEVDGLCDCALSIWPGSTPFRVMQDRSHRFQIIPRPANLKNAIHNLNVRGKRGNIVQTFPAVEHDFVPNILHCKEGEWIHAQWTGSDNNRNNVAGEGTDQTDRSCIVQTQTGKHNYPISWESQNLFSSSEALKLAFNDLQAKEDSQCKELTELLNIDNNNDRDEDAKNCGKLNPAKPYFDGGLQPCRAPGVYYYMSWRENNFSNRSQKGAVVITECNGAATCENADVLPVNADGEYDPYAGTQYDAKASTAVASLLVVSSGLWAAFW